MTEHDMPAASPVTGFLDPAPGTAMCALTLIYHADYEVAITSLLQEHMVVARYTKVRDVVGARAEALGVDDFDPDGGYHMIIVLAERVIIHTLAGVLRDLRASRGHGLRGYVSPVEDVI